MSKGIHVMFCSSHADELRAFLREQPRVLHSYVCLRPPCTASR